MAYDDEDQPMRVREAREPLLERVATLEKLNRHLSEQVDKLTDQVRALANEIGL